MKQIDLEPRRAIKYHPGLMVVGMLMGAALLLWVWLVRDNVPSHLVFTVSAGGGAIVGIFFALLTKDIPGA